MKSLLKITSDGNVYANEKITEAGKFSPSESGINLPDLNEGVEMDEVMKLNASSIQLPGEFSEYPDVIKDGLVLWYDFKGLTNSDMHRNIAHDLSGNGNHGELINFAFEEGSGYIEGSENSGGEKGLGFDGIDDHINAGNKDEFNITADLTIEIFVEKKEQGKMGGFVKGTEGAWAFNSYGLRSYINNSYIFYIVGEGGGLHQLPSSSLSIEENTHIVATTSETLGTMSIYMNGELVNTMFRTIGAIKLVRGNLELGTAYKGFYSEGVFKSARLYNRALSEQEIQHNYQMEKERWGIHDGRSAI